MSSDIFDFAVMTIFAREVLEGSIIIGQYRTLIIRCETWPEHFSRESALRAVTVSAAVASLVAVAVLCIVAIPLGILSKDFDPKTADIIEGVSKIVAAICILQFSLKMPKWLGVYESSKKPNDDSQTFASGLTLRSIRFNVAWNIWREVAECGVFLLPFFLSGDNLKSIPLSAIVGSIVGFLCGLGIYCANKKFTSKVGLAMFASTLLLFLSAGLFSGGCNAIEEATRSTTEVWAIQGDFWSVDKLPMTVIKPFGYSDTRTLLQILCFWIWLLLGCLLHFRKYRQSQRLRIEQDVQEQQTESSQCWEDASNEELDVEQQATVGQSKKVALATQETGGTDLSVELTLEDDNAISYPDHCLR